VNKRVDVKALEQLRPLFFSKTGKKTARRKGWLLKSGIYTIFRAESALVFGVLIARRRVSENVDLFSVLKSLGLFVGVGGAQDSSTSCGG
jgi:hypothetical protein